MKLWLQTLIALVLGLITGVALKYILESTGWDIEIFPYFKAVGDIFMKLIKMLLPLLLLSSMAVGVTSIKDMRRLGKLGFKTMALFVITTIIAIWIGFFLAKIIQPGIGISHTLASKSVSIESGISIKDLLFNMIPDNPIAALAAGNTLQILIFGLFLGIAVNLAGEKGEPLLHFLQSLSHIMYQLINIVMRFAPYGVFAIMAWVGGTFGWQVLRALFEFVIAIYAASIIHMLLVYGGMLLSTGLNPWMFFKGMRDAIVFAFTSSSSSASLPTSMVCAEQRLGVPSQLVNFILPIGAAINMNGTALFHGVSALFVAQAYGITLSFSHLCTITIVATLTSIGTAGAPGSGMLILGTVLAAVGLPVEALGIIWGVDRIRDMIGTVVNILGDSVVAVYLAKQEKSLKDTVYNAN
ncbi:MAG: gltT [Chlamydiales bacterium]|jgi:Na+/H+-dicarboxylate symporter|nr:gltT [Chlamydiales bacterium]